MMQKRFAPTPEALVVTAPSTIAAGLKKARPGSTVLVNPGTYAESVRLKDGVTLSAERAHGAVIEGIVTADGIQHARLEGFDIRGADGAIRIRDSDVVLSRDDISGSRTVGVEFSGNSRGAIVGCRIHNNAGGGILVTDAAAPAIENNVIEGSGAQLERRPALFVRSRVQPPIIRNIFIEEGAEPVWLTTPDEAIVRRNYFVSSEKTEERPKIRIVSAEGAPEEGRP